MRRLGLFGAFAAMLWCSAAYGQTTSTMIGDITDASTGKPVEGAVVVVKSPALQGEQVGASEATGRYMITLLPPGTYSIHVEATGYKAFSQGGIVLPLAKTIRVNVALAPVAVVAKEVVVTAKQTATVDQGSTSVGVLIERELLEKIPMGRTIESTLKITPGSADTDARVPTAFAGATGLENTYLIDGFNTTDPRRGEGGTTMPIEFMDQIGVMTGGYMPEFGRATGGIMNAVLKSGGNEFHGDIFFNYSGSWLQAIPDQLRTGALGSRSINKATMDFGVALGGPIIKDKLWFFVGFDPTVSLADVSRFIYRRYADPADPFSYLQKSPADPDNPYVESLMRRQIYNLSTQIYRYAAKLTWAVSADQRLALSAYGDPYKTSGPMINVRAGEPSTFLGSGEGGTHNVTLNYTGKFWEKRIQVEAMAGYQRTIERTTPYATGQNWIRWQTGYEAQLPEPVCAQDPSMRIATCPMPSPEYYMGGLYSQDETAERGSLAAKVTFFLPRNQVKIGADMEWNTFSSRFAYTGPVPQNAQRDYWLYSRRRDLNGDGVADQEMYRRTEGRGYVLRNPDNTPRYLNDIVAQKAFSRNFGLFLQDSWNILDNLTLNAGLRYEIQQLYGTEGPCINDDGKPCTEADFADPNVNKYASILTLNKNFAPRVGLIWDPLKDGRTKFFGSFGVYYESVPTNLGLRALSPLDVFYRNRRDFYDRGAYPGPYPLGSPSWFGGSATGIIDNISPQYHYEWIAGVEHEVIPSYRVGLSYTKRVMGNVIEDLSVDDATTYFLGNPGKGPRALGPGGEIERLTRNPGARADSHCRYRTFDDDGNPVLASLRCTGDFPEAVRDYDAWTLTFEKRRTEDQPWQFKLSYTLSWTRGNYPGLFYPTIGQADPNLSQQFDIMRTLANRSGDLPNDHRHAIKFYGSYEFSKVGVPGLSIGIGLNILSGMPVRYLGADEIYGQGEVFITSELAGRTPWYVQADLFVEYGFNLTKNMRLSFNAQIFNFLNLQEALRVDENYTAESVCALGPRAPGQSMQQYLATLRVFDDFDPITGACIPGERAPALNSNFFKPIARQAPISARLGVKLTF
jgi:outer membrane receptor protein involved in Fe transport